MSFVRVFVIGFALLLGLVTAQEQRQQDPREQIGSLEQEIVHLRERLAAVSEQAMRAGLVAAIHHIDSAEFHSIDASLAQGELNPRFLSSVRNSLTVAEATAWPEELESAASEFIQAATELAAALEAEDIAAAAEAASETHDKQHVLSHAVYAALAGEAAHAVETEPAQVPAGAVELTLEISEQGGAAGGPTTQRVKRGDKVALVVISASGGTLHLHGYDLDWELEPGQRHVFTFAATSIGRFPLELHPAGDEAGVSVGYLEVHP